MDLKIQKVPLEKLLGDVNPVLGVVVSALIASRKTGGGFDLHPRPGDPGNIDLEVAPGVDARQTLSALQQQLQVDGMLVDWSGKPGDPMYIRTPEGGTVELRHAQNVETTTSDTTTTDPAATTTQRDLRDPRARQTRQQAPETASDLPGGLTDSGNNPISTSQPVRASSIGQSITSTDLFEKYTPGTESYEALARMENVMRDFARRRGIPEDVIAELPVNVHLSERGNGAEFDWENARVSVRRGPADLPNTMRHELRHFVDAIELTAARRGNPQEFNRLINHTVESQIGTGGTRVQMLDGTPALVDRLNYSPSEAKAAREIFHDLALLTPPGTVPGLQTVADFVRSHRNSDAFAGRSIDAIAADLMGELSHANQLRNKMTLPDSFFTNHAADRPALTKYIDELSARYASNGLESNAHLARLIAEAPAAMRGRIDPSMFDYHNSPEEIRARRTDLAGQIEDTMRSLTDEERVMVREFTKGPDQLDSGWQRLFDMEQRLDKMPEGAPKELLTNQVKTLETALTAAGDIDQIRAKIQVEVAMEQIVKDHAMALSGDSDRLMARARQRAEALLPSLSEDSPAAAYLLRLGLVTPAQLSANQLERAIPSGFVQQGNPSLSRSTDPLAPGKDVEIGLRRSDNVPDTDQVSRPGTGDQKPAIQALLSDDLVTFSESSGESTSGEFAFKVFNGDGKDANSVFLFIDDSPRQAPDHPPAPSELTAIRKNANTFDRDGQTRFSYDADGRVYEYKVGDNTHQFRADMAVVNMDRVSGVTRDGVGFDYHSRRDLQRPVQQSVSDFNQQLAGDNQMSVDEFNSKMLELMNQAPAVAYSEDQLLSFNADQQSFLTAFNAPKDAQDFARKNTNCMDCLAAVYHSMVEGRITTASDVKAKIKSNGDRVGVNNPQQAETLYDAKEAQIDWLVGATRIEPPKSMNRADLDKHIETTSVKDFAVIVSFSRDGGNSNGHVFYGRMQNDGTMMYYDAQSGVRWTADSVEAANPSYHPLKPAS